MQYNLLSYWVRLQQEAFLSVMHTSRLSVRSAERLAQHQLSAARLILDGNRIQVQQLVQADGPWELLAQQPRLAAEMGTQVLEHVLETLEILVDAREALYSWFKEETNVTRRDPNSQAFFEIPPQGSNLTELRRLH